MARKIKGAFCEREMLPKKRLRSAESALEEEWQVVGDDRLPQGHLQARPLLDRADSTRDFGSLEGLVPDGWPADSEGLAGERGYERLHDQVQQHAASSCADYDSDAKMSARGASPCAPEQRPDLVYARRPLEAVNLAGGIRHNRRRRGATRSLFPNSVSAHPCSTS